MIFVLSSLYTSYFIKSLLLKQNGHMRQDTFEK